MFIFNFLLLILFDANKVFNIKRIHLIVSNSNQKIPPSENSWTLRLEIESPPIVFILPRVKETWKKLASINLKWDEKLKSKIKIMARKSCTTSS